MITRERTVRWTIVLLVVFVAGFAFIFPVRTELPFFEHGWLCWSGSAVPKKLTVNGPLEIGTDWTEIQVDGGLKSAPHFQEILLMANYSQYESDSNVTKRANRYHAVGGVFKDRATGDHTSFDVKIVDGQGRSVRLIQNMVGVDSSSGEIFAVLGFGLAHDEWSKRYFSPEFEGKTLLVRSSRPFVLASVKWSAPYQSKNPCKVWEDIRPEEIFTFNEDSPPSKYPDAELPIDREVPLFRWDEGSSK